MTKAVSSWRQETVDLKHWKNSRELYAVRTKDSNTLSLWKPRAPMSEDVQELDPWQALPAAGTPWYWSC